MDIQNIINLKIKYENMYWKKYHECQKLKQLLRDYGILDTNEMDTDMDTIYDGKVCKISENGDWGLLTTETEPSLFFHISECINFTIEPSLLHKSLTFKMATKKEKLQAVHIRYNDNHVSDYITDAEVIDLLKDVSIDLTPSDLTPLDLTPSDLISDVTVINLKLIEDANNIWYMNGKVKDVSFWNRLVENNLLYSWSFHGRNDNILHRLKIGDIIAWYIVGKGFSSIVKVTGKVEYICGNDLDLLGISEIDKISWLNSMVKYDYKTIKIPVEFLSHIDMNKCITSKDIPSITEWTSGLRGSSCMKPSKQEWNKQVIEMYKYMCQ